MSGKSTTKEEEELIRLLTNPAAEKDGGKKQRKTKERAAASSSSGQAAGTGTFVAPPATSFVRQHPTVGRTKRKSMAVPGGLGRTGRMSAATSAERRRRRSSFVNKNGDAVPVPDAIAAMK